MSITETQLLLEQGKKACYETFEHDKALSLYEEAIAVSPEFANAYAEKANVLRYQHKYQEALDFANKAIDLNPNYANAYNTKGNCLYCLERYEEAIEYYTKAIELNPDDLNSKKWKQKALEQISLKQDK